MIEFFGGCHIDSSLESTLRVLQCQYSNTTLGWGQPLFWESGRLG
jgi:hypothetical protein